MSVAAPLAKTELTDTLLACNVADSGRVKWVDGT